MGFKEHAQKVMTNIEEIRAKEEMVARNYDKDEINQAIKHTREDVSGILTMQIYFLSLLHQIRNLLVIILIVGIIAIVLFGN